MTTLVVSDLHLGARSGADLLRRPPAREALEAALSGVERLVLLGDVVELRERPAPEALEDARPVLEALGAALGRDGRAVLVAGNHDHRLVSPWLARRRAEGDSLGLEQIVAPRDASTAAEAIAGWMSPARLDVAYPGLWLADDVYATHGHYLDRHVTTPALEPFAIRASERLLARRRPPPGGVDGYEAVAGGVYGVVDELAQGRRGGPATGASPSHRAYRVLTGDDGSWSQRLLAGVAFPAAVAVANRVGLGPMSADISGPQLRRAALRAMGEVVRGLEIRAAHVVFGHTHRAGPLPGDDLDEWVAPGGARLHNSGTWIHESYLVGDPPHESPYWAGGAVRIRPGEPPEHLRLLPGARARLLA